MENRSIFTGVNSITFNQKFKNDSDCLSYIAAIKWEKGYRCKRCSNTKFIKGVKPFNRRCLKCKYDESPTAGTMFDKVKFSILLAFHLGFKIATKKKGMSSLVRLRRMNCDKKLVGSLNGRYNKLCRVVYCIP